ncbi:MAG TPA: GDSL-type esterase/lipase family protein [Polyangiaceae bacterium]|nr:GDSL-type esterase/lipase family protein [Polyangiaceae bacterium]
MLLHKIPYSRQITGSRCPAAVSCGLFVAGVLLLGCGDDEDDPEEATGSARGASAYATWAASPQDYNELLPFPGAPAPTPLQLDDQSLRQIVRLSAGGERLRVHLSNRFGAAPVTFDAVGVARSSGGSSIDAASHVALMFDGSPSVTLAAGAEVWSDYVEFAADAESSVAVSAYVSGVAPIATVHTLGQQTAYVAAGDAVSAGTFPAIAETPPRTFFSWLTGVDAESATARRVVVTFGDSITDGFNSTVDANRRYPNFLSEQLTAGDAPVSVVNAGISGNRVLNDVIGPSGVSRFERDVLGQTAVSDVVILLGINDIGFSGFVADQAVSVEQITDGLASFVAAANDADVNVFLATLLPFGNTMPPYFSDEGEAKREAVNDWIRANTDIAGVVDFDQVMGDASNPLVLPMAFDSGDGLHPNDDGYEAMGNAAADTLRE